MGEYLIPLLITCSLVILVAVVIPSYLDARKESDDQKHA